MTTLSPLQNPSTRLVRLHEEWRPHKFQRRGVEFLTTHGSAALFWDPGLGKTATVLEAFRALRERKMVKRMLVVAPLRVCQLVWAQEGAKWTQFRDLTFSLLHGPKKGRILKEQTDIHLINPEGVAWLSKQFYGRSSLPYDVVVIDELTKFKNHRAQRSKALRKKLEKVRYRWGLTGTPAPNGYMDLFGQMLILDDGASLGRYITYFRDQYFVKGYDGFSYLLQPGADTRIEQRIEPYVLRMSAEDYLDLPPLVDHEILVDLPSDARERYDEMKKEMLLTLPEGEVTAANAAATYSKLKQMANGAVYLSDYTDRTDQRKKKWVELHAVKLDALEELIEELSGQPLLVAYEFQSDLARLRERLGADTPTLSGLSAKRITEVAAQWNRGELPVLLVHPASAGHGLNLQGAGASHICWFSRPWDLEMYDQTIRRIYRQGSASARVVNHVIVVRNTLDETVAEALKSKDTTQQRLLTALNAEITDDDLTTTPHGAPTTEEDVALKKMGFLNSPSDDEQGDEQEAAPVAPKGWGTPGAKPAAEPAEQPKKIKGWGPPGGGVPDEQRASIRKRLKGDAPPEPSSDEQEEEEVPTAIKGWGAFPANIRGALTGDGDTDTDEPDDDGDESGESGEGAADPYEPSWEHVSGYCANPLKAAGFESPREAFEAGKAALMQVPRFGKKGWTELRELFEDGEEEQDGDDESDDDEAQTTTADSGPALPRPSKAPGWDEVEPNLFAKRRNVESDDALRESGGYRGEQMTSAQPESFAGANPSTLASLFDSIAALLRGQ